MSDPRSDAQKQTDPTVAQAYRDLATERAPAALDDLVLNKARNAAPSGYAGSVRWLRPMAWAATAVLSLAIVVQLADIPVATPPASKTLRADDARREASAATLPDAVDEQEASTGNALPPPALSGQKSSSQDRGDAAAPRQAFVVSEAPILEEAAQIARMQKSPNPQGDLAFAPARSAPQASTDGLGTVSRPACEPQARRDAERWYECIIALEKDGLGDLAKHERQQFDRVFPDFAWPLEHD